MSRFAHWDGIDWLMLAVIFSSIGLSVERLGVDGLTVGNVSSLSGWATALFLFLAIQRMRQ